MIYNIRVPTVYPGLVQTGLFENTPSVNTTGKKKKSHIYMECFSQSWSIQYNRVIQDLLHCRGKWIWCSTECMIQYDD